MTMELIEYVIARTENGQIKYHTEGAQSVFGLTRAKKIAKALGPPWKAMKQTPGEDDGR